MTSKKTTFDIVFGLANVVFLIIFIILMLYPLIHILFASLSDSTELMRHNGLLLKPLGFNLNSYKAVFTNPLIISGYKNTLFILVVGVTINLLLTSLGAYFLSRKDVMLTNVVMVLIVVTMFFNGGLIPRFLNIKQLGLYDSLWAVILPFAINTFNLIIMRTAFLAIPDSLEESAQLDGANDFVILFKIIIPLSMPVIAVMILYYGVHHWNSWLFAVMLIREKTHMPLQVVLRDILIQNNTEFMSEAAQNGNGSQNVAETIKYATIIVATVPILMVYPFLQKYFAKGVLVGAVKG